MVSEGQIMHCPVGGYNTQPKNAREQFALSIAELRLPLTNTLWLVGEWSWEWLYQSISQLLNQNLYLNTMGVILVARGSSEIKPLKVNITNDPLV